MSRVDCGLNVDFRKKTRLSNQIWLRNLLSFTEKSERIIFYALIGGGAVERMKKS